MWLQRLHSQEFQPLPFKGLDTSGAQTLPHILSKDLEPEKQAKGTAQPITLGSAVRATSRGTTRHTRRPSLCLEPCSHYLRELDSQDRSKCGQGAGQWEFPTGNKMLVLGTTLGTTPHGVTLTSEKRICHSKEAKT